MGGGEGGYGGPGGHAKLHVDSDVTPVAVTSSQM